MTAELQGLVLAALAVLGLVNLVLLLRQRGVDEAGLLRAVAEAQRVEGGEIRATLAEAERALRDRAERSSIEARSMLGDLEAKIERGQGDQRTVLETRLGSLSTQAAREAGEQRVLLETKLREMGEQSVQRLAAIQHSVNAQLAQSIEKSIEKEMQGSFQRVIDQFGLVQKAMTDVQAVTGQIGDLKRLFSNVKARGGWGEGQLRALLVDILPEGAWHANRRLRDDSDDVVEFVLVMPSHAQPRPFLALDAKFPSEDYDRLLLASEAGHAEDERAARKALEARLRGEARKIASKYIVPPVTVDFAVMFLPTDGLYVEAARMPGLIEGIGREHRVLVMSPALLPGLVRSVHIGAMSLTIAENAERIGRTLGAVRAEFRRIDDVLGKLEKQTGTANRTVAAARVRTKAMERTLKNVEIVSGPEAALVLPLEDALLDDGNENED